MKVLKLNEEQKLYMDTLRELSDLLRHLQGALGDLWDTVNNEPCINIIKITRDFEQIQNDFKELLDCLKENFWCDSDIHFMIVHFLGMIKIYVHKVCVEPVEWAVHEHELLQVLEEKCETLSKNCIEFVRKFHIELQQLNENR